MIKYMASLGFLPDIPLEHIRDKSKADFLAKTLIIIQALWLVLQVTMRWASGLLVTTLELSTLAHAICTLFIYALWWHKPLDVESTSEISGEETVAGIAALCWEYSLNRPVKTVSSAASLAREVPEDVLHRLGHEDFSHQSFETITETQSSEPSQSPLPPLPKAPLMLVGNVIRPHLESHTSYSLFHELCDGQISKSVIIRVDQVKFKAGRRERIAPLINSRHECPRECELARKRTQSMTLHRWALILQLHTESPEIFDNLGLKVTQSSVTISSDSSPVGVIASLFCLEATGAATFEPQIFRNIGNFSTWVLYHAHLSTTISACGVFCFCRLAYAGLHAAAWNQYFPSEIEQYMWHIATSSMVAL